MNIGEATAQTRVPAKTIRYYEDIGLIPPPRRASNGYRCYDRATIHALRFIKRARSLGFSVEECRNLLSLYKDRQRTSAEVKHFAQQRVADIDRKMAELAAMRIALTRLIDCCPGDERPDCPILEDLSRIHASGE